MDSQRIGYGANKRAQRPHVLCAVVFNYNSPCCWDNVGKYTAMSTEESYRKLNIKIFGGIKSGKLEKLVTDNNDRNLSNMLREAIAIEDYEVCGIIQAEIVKRQIK